MVRVRRGKKNEKTHYNCDSYKQVKGEEYALNDNVDIRYQIKYGK